MGVENILWDVRANVSGRTELEKMVVATNKADKSVASLQKQNKSLGKSFSSINLGATAAAVSVSAIGGALIVAGKEIFDATRKFEALKTELKFFAEGAGASKQEAEALFNRLNQFALENPLANLETTISNVKDLLNKDIDIKLAEQLGKSFVDITAGSLEAQNALARVVGQAKLQGRVLTNDLEQFTTANVDIISLLNKLPQYATKSAKEIKKLISEGKIGFEDISQSLIKSTQEGGKFFGRSAAAAKTLNGQVLALEDALFNLKATIGSAASGEMAGFVEKMVEATNAVRKWFETTEGQKFSSDIVTGINDILTAMNNLLGALVGEQGSTIRGFMGLVARDWKIATDIIAASINTVNGIIKANENRRELAAAALEREGVGQSLDFITAGLGLTSLVGQETKIFAEKKKNEEAYQKEVENTYRRLQKIKEAAVTGRSILGNQDKEEIETARKLLADLKITDVKQLPGSKLIGEENKAILVELLKQQEGAIATKKGLDEKDLQARKDAKEKALKEEKDRQEKLKDLQEKDIQILKDYLQKMIESRNDYLSKIKDYNDELEKVIKSNNDKIAELNEDDGTNSIEKIKAKGEREKQAELDQLKDRQKALEKEQSEYLSKLAEIRRDLQEKQAELQKDGAELVGKRGGGFISNKQLNSEIRNFQAYSNEITTKIAETKDKINTISGQIEIISSLRTDKEIKAFNEQIISAFIDLNRITIEAQNENNSLRIQLMQDNYDKELMLLNESSAKEVEATEFYFDEKIAAFKAFAIENSLEEEDYANELYNLEVEKYNKLTLLAEKYYKDLRDLRVKEIEKQIQENNSLSQGNISTFEEIASLQKTQAFGQKSGATGTFSDIAKNKELQRIEDEKSLNILNERIKALKIEVQLEQEKAELRANGGVISNEDAAKIKGIYAEIAQAEEQIAKQTSETQTKLLDEKIKKFVEITDYAKQFSDLIFSFFEKSNQAEINAIDRQIALQEKRLSTAKELAEKGNAELLQLEQNRLDQLEQKRELAANRQIALQRKQQIAAQSLAVAQVIAQTAGTPGGIFAIPLAVAALLATLAEGLGQAQQYNEGTPYVRGKRARNTPVDNIPAWLTEGERVIPKALNERYSSLYNAIENGHFDNWVNSINYGLKSKTKVEKAQQSQRTTNTIDYDLLAKSIAKNIKTDSITTVNFSLDEEGLRLRSQAQNARLEHRRKNR